MVIIKTDEEMEYQLDRNFERVVWKTKDGDEITIWTDLEDKKKAIRKGEKIFERIYDGMFTPKQLEEFNAALRQHYGQESKPEPPKKKKRTYEVQKLIDPGDHFFDAEEVARQIIKEIDPGAMGCGILNDVVVRKMYGLEEEEEE